MQNSVSNANSEKQRKAALTVISVIFFLFGFITCLNDILIPHLKSVFQLDYTQSALVQFTFFGAYFLVALPAGAVTFKIGYKKTIALGLFICGIGAFCFYPAAQYIVYPLFLGALFILAAGITFLQVAANPYVSVLGDEKTASARLNLVQALNSLGTMIAPVFGGFLILAGTVLSPAELASRPEAEQAAYKLTQAHSVQGPYIGFGIAFILLAVALSLFHFPDPAGHHSQAEKQEGTFAQVLKHRSVILGVIGLFVYVGAEVSIGSFLINFMAEKNIAGMPEATGASYVPLYWGGAMVGRFLGAALLRKINPGKMLMGVAVIAAALVAATILGTGMMAAWTLLAVGLFNSIMFPTIFSLSIRGLGPLTEKASSLLIMAIVGGAVIPLLQGVMADHFGLQHAFILPLLCYVYIAFYGWTASSASSSELGSARSSH